MATKSDGEADWEWATGHWVLEVPEELAACEPECRKGECLEGEWDRCERRMERMGKE